MADIDLYAVDRVATCWPTGNSRQINLKNKKIKNKEKFVRQFVFKFPPTAKVIWRIGHDRLKLLKFSSFDGTIILYEK